MQRKFTFILLFFLLLVSPTFARFNFNANCMSALEAIFDLKLEQARSLIAKEKAQNPGNGIAIYLENYVDYFALMVSDSKADFERLKNQKSARLAALEKLDKNSPYYLFTQAEINLQSGLAKSKFQDFIGSGMDFKKAHSLLLSNAAKFPYFSPNKKSMGLINVIFGSIPSNLKGLFSIVGIKGNTSAGMQTLEQLMVELPKGNYAFFRDEVIFFLCYIETELLLNKVNYNKVISYTQKMSDESLLKAYLQGYVSLKNGQNDKALEYFSKRPTGSQYVHFPFMFYLHGNAKLQRGDADAGSYYVKFLNTYKGGSNIKDAYLKLAYHHLIKGEMDQYNAQIKNVLTKGNATDEKDKQALKEAKDAMPDLDLLEARFYFDGGYYNKALIQLNNKKLQDFKQTRDHIELYYRLGRIYDEQNRDELALSNYAKAIKLGSNSTYYYAANAALFSGQIYEKLKQNANAISFYQQAVNMKNHEYEKSIESRAKTALKRLGR